MFVNDVPPFWDMAKKYKILCSLASLVFVLDQLTKSFVLKYLAIGESIPVIKEFFDLVHVRNRGAAFGMFHLLEDSIRVPFFYGVSFIAFFSLLYFFRQLKENQLYYAAPMSLIAGGILGNLVDRVRYGDVVDFISLRINDKIFLGVLMEWPAFNVADSAITISMIWISILVLRGK